MTSIKGGKMRKKDKPFYKLGKILKDRRLLLDITIPELSYKTGIDKPSLYYYERGDVEPNMRNFVKLCTTLGFDIEDFEGIC